MRWLADRSVLVFLAIGLLGCLSCQAASAPAPTLAPTAVPAPTATPPPTSAPTATAQPTRTPTPVPAAAHKTVRVPVSFDTYETEETVQAELSAVPGVLSLVVTQLEVSATYDPARVSPDEILRVLRNNPEVKLRGEPQEEESAT